MVNKDLFLKKIWRKISMHAKETQLLDKKNLIALHFSNMSKLVEAVAIVQKNKIPYDVEDLVQFVRLIVPSDAVRLIKGHDNQFPAIHIKHLPEYIQKNNTKKIKRGWHGNLNSPALKAALSYKYYLIDYVKKNIALYKEAFRITFLSPKKT